MLYALYLYVMKSHAHILAAFLLILMISFYYVQDITEKYSQVLVKIEFSDKSDNSQGLISSESSFEEDIPVLALKNPFRFANSGCEGFSTFTYFHPAELHYSIWQPPKIS